ncbi:MAG: TniB family NTP-binding protein [Verrucomicrobia bacterium]|nr:TniB family NTP-binding protein [Verrucomicrobiota bacterium]
MDNTEYTFREQRIFLNCLRFLANDLHSPPVCVGTNEAKQAVMTDQQLADRFEARALPAWRDDTGFHQLLASCGSTLPVPASFCSTRSTDTQTHSSPDKRSDRARLSTAGGSGRRPRF